MSALVLGAPQPALASGQTAFTCVEDAVTKSFKTEHCKPGEAGSKFGEVKITEQTHAKFSNANTNETTSGPESMVLTAVLAGVEVEVSFPSAEGVGTLKNIEVGKELEMQGAAETNGSGLTFTGVFVKKPLGKGCSIYDDVVGPPEEGENGVVRTEPIKGKTVQNGAKDEVQIEPVSGTTLAAFWLTCTDPSIPKEMQGKWPITGSFKCPTSGATIVCSVAEIKTQNTLKAKGAKAGLSGKGTITAGKEEAEAPTHPISISTGEGSETETPPPPVSGTTGFTCGPRTQPNGEAGFSKAHCKPGDAVGTNAAWGHTVAGSGVSTEAIGSNQSTGSGTESSTPMKLKATTAGIDTEIQATGVSSTGTIENMLTEKEHTITGAGTVTFTGVTVAKPEGGGCKVKGGEVKSKEMKGTTAGQGDAAKFEPASGTLIASFEVEGCSTEALNGTYEVKGTIKGTPEGATVNFTEEGTTSQGTLTMKGATAGLEGSVTISGRVKGSGSNYTAISPTTVTTE